jgi:hypothetical protein
VRLSGGGLVFKRQKANDAQACLEFPQAEAGHQLNI